MPSTNVAEPRMSSTISEIKMEHAPIEIELVYRATFEMPPQKVGEKVLECFFFQKQRDASLFKIDSFAEILSPTFCGGISHAALWGSLTSGVIATPLRHHNLLCKEKVPGRCRGLSPKP